MMTMAAPAHVVQVGTSAKKTKPNAARLGVTTGEGELTQTTPAAALSSHSSMARMIFVFPSWV